MSAPRHGGHRNALATSLVLLIFVCLYAATGYWTLDPASRAVPLLAALVTAVLIVCELVKRIRVRAPAGEQSHDRSAGVSYELLVLASVVAAVAGIYVVGFLVALPLYLALAIALLGRQPWRIAIATAALTTIAIYVAFEVVLSYRLYAGIVFS